MFVENSGKNLNHTYSAHDISKLIVGHYGEEKFMNKLGEIQKGEVQDANIS